MNLKPSPLVEASAVLGIAIFGIFLTFTITSANLQTGLTMVTNTATTFLLPMFTFWAVIGLFVRNKSKLYRFVTSLVISAIVTGVLSNLFISAVGDSTIGSDADRQSAQAIVAGMALVTFFAAAVGAVLTYFWLIRERNAKA